MRVNRIRKNEKGFSLIEMLIFLFIFVVATVSLFQAFTMGINYIIDSKKRLQAVELANERLERVRNLGFENLVQGAPPPETVVRNGITFQVQTNVLLEDDPADGTVLGGTDLIGFDYFRVEIEVAWGAGTGERSIELSEIVVPPIREEDADKGYLRLYVVDQNGDGLPSAEVEIRNLDTNDVAFDDNVSATGTLFLAGLEPGPYKITVYNGLGDDYFEVATRDLTGSYVPDGQFEHVELVGRAVVYKLIVTDTESGMDVEVNDFYGNTVSGSDFEVKGGVLWGTDSGVNDYSLEQSFSNSDGTESFSDISFGRYYFTFTGLDDLNGGSDDFKFLWMKMNGLIDDAGADQVLLNAGTTGEAEAVLANKNVPALLVTVRDDVDDAVIYDARVEIDRDIPDPDPDFDEEEQTNEFGMAYFPLASGTMTSGEYEYTVTLEGYETENETVNVGSGLTEITVELEPE